jgi:hypothetical protein
MRVAIAIWLLFNVLYVAGAYLVARRLGRLR